MSVKNMQKAIELVTTAVEEDRNHNYQKALEFYERGVESFLHVYKFDVFGDKAKEAIMTKCTIYVERAELIRDAFRKGKLKEYENEESVQLNMEKTTVKYIKNKENSKMENLIVELECPVCMDYMKIPIRLCVRGHSICGKCFEKLDRCALCRNEFAKSRNVTLEALAMKMDYPCVYKDAGCTKVLPYAESEKHEQICYFGILKENVSKETTS